jgi:TolB-like protein
MKNFLLTALLVLIGTITFAQERIAVFPFEDMDNVFTRNESVMFYREFSNEFTNRSAGRFSVIPRQYIERLINTEGAFQLSDFSAREKTAEMNSVLNGNQILSGLIGRVGNNIRITVSLYTYPELQQLPGGATLSVSNKNELFSKIPELVLGIQNEIAGTERPVPEGLAYEINERGVIITKYVGNASTIYIPSQIQGLPVIAIGNSAFSDSNSLTIVNIPSSVTDIGSFAFSNCRSLTSVNIPSSVTSIRFSAFSSCRSLISANIPSSVTSIENYAFSWCSRFTSINIPSSVTDIGHSAFSGCISLISITVDSRNPTYASVDGILFDKTFRTIIQYPAGKLAGTYTIPSSVTSIAIGAFSGCIRLTGVNIPFSVTSIGNSAFDGCSSLASITADSRNPVYASVDGILFDKTIRTIIQYPAGKQASGNKGQKKKLFVIYGGFYEERSFAPDNWFASFSNFKIAHRNL